MNPKYRVVQVDNLFYIECSYNGGQKWLRYEYMDYDSLEDALAIIKQFKVLHGDIRPKVVVWSD